MPLTFLDCLFLSGLSRHFLYLKRLARLKADLWLADEGLLREVKTVSVKRKVEGVPFLDDSC